MKINFAKYLLEILLEHGKVDVPGLGKFEMERKPSSFGDGRKSLKGPQQEIVFREEHDANDLKLQERIAAKESPQVDQAKAAEFVNQFTSDVLKGLMENEEVEIAYIGTIKRGSDEQIGFTQNQATADKLNKYLPEVELPKAEKSPVEEIKVKSEPVAKPASSIKEDIKAEPVQSYVEADKSGLAWLKWLVGILGLVILSTLLFKMCGKEDGSAYRSNQTEENTEQIADSTEMNNKETAEKTNDPEEVSEETEMNAEEENDRSDSDVIDASDFNKEKCIVIIGSYQSAKNVRGAANKIESKGYQVYKETHGAYTRVGLNMNCEDIDGRYENFVNDVSREFGVNAWFLSPEVKR